jgi:DNA polymerase III alpha subunit
MNQMILNESDVVDAWLSDRNIISAIFDDPEPINIYNQWCDTNSIDKKIEVKSEYSGDNFVEYCTGLDNWNMPEEYKTLDLHDYLLNKISALGFDKISIQYKRMMLELAMFEERGLIPVLKFLVYLVDTCRKNNIVLGVGRGSSVASYCLYLIGVHKVDSIKYNLDIQEFLK